MGSLRPAQSQSWVCSPAGDICLHPHHTDSFKRPGGGCLPTLWAGATMVGSLLGSRLQTCFQRVLSR